MRRSGARVELSEAKAQCGRRIDVVALEIAVGQSALALDGFVFEDQPSVAVRDALASRVM